MLITQEYVNGIIENAKKVKKNALIQAVELKEAKELQSKEGVVRGEVGDFEIVTNGDAAANYIIKRDNFLAMYELVESNYYRKSVISLSYIINEQFSVIPSWNNGMPLHSSISGAHLMIYGEGDFNICSFEDFEKTYIYVKQQKKQTFLFKKSAFLSYI